MISILFDINIEYSLDVHPVSTNDMYFSRPKKTTKGKWSTYQIRTPELQSFQKIMKEDIMPNAYPEEYLTKLPEIVHKSSPYGLSHVIVFMMPEDHYWDSDTSNYLKALEDCIVNYSGVDDKFNVILTVAKGLSTDSSWHIYVKTSVCHRVLKQDYNNYLSNERS